MHEFAPPNPSLPIHPNIVVPALSPPTSAENVVQSTVPTSNEDSLSSNEITVRRVERTLGSVAAISAVAGDEANHERSSRAYYEFEELPPHLKSGITQELGQNSGSMKTLVENYRQEMLSGGNWHEKVANAYKVVRNIGDSLVTQGGSDRSVVSLLEASRTQARPVSFESIDTDDTLARYDERTRRLGILESDVIKNAKTVEGNLKVGSVEIINPSDPELFLMVQTVAHEAAHGMLAGISKLIADRASKENGSKITQVSGALASRLYISAHPEDALTGDLRTDILTQEERFAEGYGQLVVDAVAAELGYDEDARAHLKKIFDEKTALTKAPQGTHAFDVLGDVGAGRTLLAAAREKGIRDIFLGDLGYSTALSQSEVTEQLRALSAAIASGNISEETMFMPDEVWQQLVKAKQSDATKAVIARQLAVRQKAPVLS